MVKLSFRLQKALDWRRQNLAAQKAALQQIGARAREVDTAAQALRKHWRQQERSIQDAAEMDGRDLQLLAELLKSVQNQLTRLSRLRQEIEAQAAAQRRRIGDTHRQVRVLEQLEYRRRQEWLRQLTAEENALASELFLAATVRRNSAAQAEEEKAQ